MNKKIILIVLTLILFTGGVVYLVTSFGGSDMVFEENLSPNTNESENATNNDDIFYTDLGGINASSNTSNTTVNDTTIAPPGLYDIYDSSRVSGASGRIVLFFHSIRCSSCEGLEKDLLLNRRNIPTGITILDVDYENGVEFKEKYGVELNHTLVEIDKEGNLIKKWIGSRNLKELIKDLQ